MWKNRLIGKFVHIQLFDRALIRYSFSISSLNWLLWMKSVQNCQNWYQCSVGISIIHRKHGKRSATVFIFRSCQNIISAKNRKKYLFHRTEKCRLLLTLISNKCSSFPRKKVVWWHTWKNLLSEHLHLALVWSFMCIILISMSTNTIFAN